MVASKFEPFFSSTNYYVWNMQDNENTALYSLKCNQPACRISTSDEINMYIFKNQPI